MIIWKGFLLCQFQARKEIVAFYFLEMGKVGYLSIGSSKPWFPMLNQYNFLSLDCFYREPDWEILAYLGLDSNVSGRGEIKGDLQAGDCIVHSHLSRWLWHQLLANAIGRAVENNASTWILTSHVRDPKGVCGSWSLPGSTQLLKHLGHK